MIDFLILVALLIWTALAMVVDSHKESKTEPIIEYRKGQPRYKGWTEPPELSTVGQIAVLPLTIGLKIVSVLSVVWNRVLYKQEVREE